MSDENKVIDLNPEKPSPHSVLATAMKDVDKIDSIIVLIQDKDGNVWSGWSDMHVATAALLSKFLDADILRQIGYTMEEE